MAGRKKTDNTYTLENTIARWNSLFNTKYAGVDYLIAMQNALGNNPFIQNQRLKQLKSYPVFADRDTLENALQNPGSNEITLREASWSLSSTTYPLYKLMRLYSDILTYRYYAYSKYVSPKDMKTPRYKSDSKIVHMWLDKFKPKYTFRRIALEVAREGKKAYYLRQNIDTTTGRERVDYAILQELPSDWWKPTYKGDDSYIGVSFNFVYFFQPGTSVDQFPPIFRKLYENMLSFTNRTPSGEFDGFVGEAPDNVMVEYMHGNWYWWAELPDDECFVFSSDESHMWQVPMFIGLFLHSQDLSSYQLLQQQLTSVPLNSIVLGEIPFHDGKGGSGTYTNDLRLSDTMVTGFVDMFNTVAPPGSTIFAAPFQNMKVVNFPQVTNGEKIYAEALQQLISSASINGLQSTSEKPTVAQVKDSEKIESRLADVIYDQFMNCVNVIFEKKLGLKYTWKFKMFGNVFQDKDTIDVVSKGLSMGQSYLLPYYGAMFDLDMEDVDSLANQVKSSGIYGKMIMVQSAFQSSDKKNGRPINENPDSQATADSQDAGTNLSENRSFAHLNCIVCGNDIPYGRNSVFCSLDCEEIFVGEHDEL